MPGVRKAIIKFEAKEAWVTYDSKQATILKMVEALKKEGFDASFKSRPKKKA